VSAQEHDHQRHEPAPGEARLPATPLLPDSTVRIGGEIREVFLKDTRLAFQVRGADRDGQLIANRDLDVRLTATTRLGRDPIDGLQLSAWLDLLPSDSSLSPTQCRARIGSYLQGSLGARPTVDLNGYFVAALNDGNTITVIDPLLGFGSTKLYTTVALPGVGEDWAIDSTGQRLYVTLPRINQVALIETGNWKLVTAMPAGFRPTRVVVSPDGSKVWVDNVTSGNRQGAMVALEPNTLAIQGQVPIGSGEHDIALDPGGDRMYVTSRESMELALISSRDMRKLAERPLGAPPLSVAVSDAAHRVYVGLENGVVLLLDPAGLTEVNRITGIGGPARAGVSPDGRWVFITSETERLVRVAEAATGRVLHQFQVKEGADQVLFTEGSAYVRSPATPEVLVVPLAKLGLATPPSVFRFDAGKFAPAQFNQVVAAPAAGIAPDMADAVYIPNPGEKVIFYYHSGMNAPMGSLKNYGWSPRAILAIGRQIRERAPGQYKALIRAPEPGRYALGVLAHGTGIAQCFEFTVRPDSAAAASARRSTMVQVDSLEAVGPWIATDSVRVRFRLHYRSSKEVLERAEDLVAQFSSPAGISIRVLARVLEDGRYQADFVPPEPGVYYLFVASPKLGIRLSDQSPVTIEVLSRNAGTAPRS
jgi:hypothetical protein